MTRLLFPVLFLAIQGAGVAAAAVCQGPVCDWASGGHWVSPAVRVPLVAAGVIVAEIALLAAAWPGARHGADWLTRGRSNRQSFNPRAFAADGLTAATATEPVQTR